MRFHTISLFSLCSSVALAEFLDGTYPPPYDLSSEDSLVAAAWQNFTDTFDSFLRNDGEIPEIAAFVPNISFATAMFSLYDPEAANLQYHYASPETRNKANGTNTIDGDSIFRVASVSKLFTVFAGLLELTDEQWNTPLTEIFPRLAQASQQNPGTESPIKHIQWGKITAFSLARQIAGLPGGGWPTLDRVQPAAYGLPNTFPEEYGFPPATINEDNPCWVGYGVTGTAWCGMEETIAAFTTLMPAFEPFAQPHYTNPGFILLGITISELLGKDWATIYNESIIQPLGMTGTFSEPPLSEDAMANSAVVGQPEVWYLPGGLTTPSGGIFSTANDLIKLGTAILNHTLYPEDLTRKWMKPFSFTASYSYAVGAPWEIIRYASPTTGKVTDIYTKSGDSGAFGGMLAIIPEYQAGFVMLNGAANITIRTPAANAVLDTLSSLIMPALEAQAAAEARAKYVGTYVSTDPNLNSSLTVTFNRSNIGGVTGALSLSAWTTNSTNSMGIFGDDIIPRLLPAINNAQPDQPGRVAFKASTNPQYVTYAPYTEQGLGPFSAFYDTNGDWVITDSGGMYYDGKAYNEFIFDVDGMGRAVGVMPAVTGVRMERRREE
jgi:CubicO group peptidase (beta-lactamase class C family)